MNKVKSILVVEDDAYIAVDLEDVLTNAGYRVIGPVASVRHALEKMESETPDLALLDYNLGTETSVVIAQRLNAMRIPFVFLSGQTSEVVLGGEETLQRKTVLSKPFVPRVLLNELESVAA